ncbi:serine--tRNA ligase [Phycicoccus sp. SLBN-51]|uniref:serine--tRNA ligase n=1 Tax=Phycicoccus sp. SLBN-51 TaxID=2768447 RepID=UPI001153D738|nr:serine--tRNA ligase [Phycicoccus sp. SLBN-51]TQJ48990.1 seryl-tRNA synthetase [Phycicoccus sp. SLBN-51]
MIDIKLLREDPDRVRASQRARGEDEGVVDQILAADERRRSSLTEFERLRAEQKSMGKQVAQAQGEAKQALLAQTKEMAAKVKELQATATEAEELLDTLVRRVGNVIEPGVPVGGEDDYVVLETVGEPRQFDFEPKDHLALGEALDAIDMERGARVGGSRFYFLKGVGARLEIAMMNLALAQAVEHGFVPMITPTLVTPQVMGGAGFLDAHSDEVYRLEADDLYLTGTSEVALAGYHTDEILDLSADAKRYAGWSTCYRREAGSYGKDTRGIIRVHQFNKLEMFVYCRPEDAVAEHQRLLAMEKEMLAKIEVPYRIIDTAAGDLGGPAARKYDCEAWVPTQGRYRELTSTSNCTTYQARRLNTRYRTDKGTQTAATLNGTLATTRWLVAILENHQQADGSVVVPQALQPYLGLEVLKPV